MWRDRNSLGTGIFEEKLREEQERERERYIYIYIDREREFGERESLEGRRVGARRRRLLYSLLQLYLHKRNNNFSKKHLRAYACTGNSPLTSMP